MDPIYCKCVFPSCCSKGDRAEKKRERGAGRVGMIILYTILAVLFSGLLFFTLDEMFYHLTRFFSSGAKLESVKLFVRKSLRRIKRSKVFQNAKSELEV